MSEKPDSIRVHRLNGLAAPKSAIATAALRRKRSLSGAACCAAASAALLVSQSARATDYQWSTAGNGNWNDAVNWTPNTAFPVAGDTATFNAAAADGANATIAMNGAQAAASLTFVNTSSTTFTHTAGQTLTLTNGFTVNNGVGGVVLGSAAVTSAFINLAGTNQTFLNNGGAAPVLINGAITNAGNANPVTLTLDGTGTGGIQNQGGTSTPGITDGGGGAVSIVKNGTGTWQLNNNGTSGFTGNVTINAGLLKVNGSNALGTSTKTLTINAGGGIAAVGGRIIPAPVSLVINGDCTFGTGTTGGSAIQFLGTVDLGGATRSMVMNNTVTFSGAISNGGITKALSGSNNTTMTLLSTSNTYSGPTTILAGTLSPGTSAIGGNGMYSANSPLILASGATLAANFSSAQTIASLSDYQGGGGTINMGNVSADNITLGGDNTSTTFSGVFAGTDPNANGGVIKVGTGTFTLLGASTFNGYLKVNNGTVAFNTIGNIGAANSALFAPTAAAIGTISLGSTTDGGLRYIGSTAASTDRVINLAGTTGGGVLDASGTGAGTITYTSNLTVTGAGAKTLTLTGSNTGANTIAGVIPDGASSTALAKAGTGTWVLTGANTYTGPTSVSAGKLSIAGNLTKSSAVTITGGTLEMAAGGGSNRVLVAPLVSVTGTGRLDLQDNKVITQTPVGTTTGAVYSDITGMIQSGRNGGDWSGSGIVTSQSNATSSILNSIGVATAKQAKNLANPTDTVVFAGQTVTGSDTLVMYTYGGDANLDGKIDISDYGRIDFNIPLGTNGWYNGDFNYDGRINISDYGIIDFNIGIQGAQLPTGGGVAGGTAGIAGVTAVPEPVGISVLAVGAAVAGLRRRRRCNGTTR